MLKNILAQAIAKETHSDAVDVYAGMYEEDYDFSNELIDLEANTDAMNRVQFALEALSELYLKMDKRLNVTESPVSMEMGQMFYDQACTLLALCDEEWPVATPTFESNDTLSTDLHIAMEGVGDVLKRVVNKFGGLYEGQIELLNNFFDVFFARLNGLQKRVESQRVALERSGDTPKKDTLKIAKGKRLYIPGKQQTIPTAEDVETFTQDILRWSDMSALRDAIDVAIEASKAEEITDRTNNRVTATQKAIIEHYGLVISTEHKGMFGSLSSALFNKEAMISKQALMGGIRIAATIGKPKGDSGEYGRLYLTDLKPDLTAGRPAKKSFVASAPTKADLEALNRATEELIKGMIQLKRDHKENIATLNKHKASLNELRRLPPRQLALLLAGSLVPGISVGVFNLMMVFRWANMMSLTSRQLYRHGGYVASALLSATGAGIANLKE